MGFRAWIFRSYFPVSNIYEFFQLALNPSKIVKTLNVNLEHYDSWLNYTSPAFRKHFLSLTSFTILIWYLLAISFFSAVKKKILIFFRLA